jgi:hypothetical protein
MENFIVSFLCHLLTHILQDITIVIVEIVPTFNRKIYAEAWGSDEFK